ncbi:MAG: class I SAM-dependent methyltransferase [Candidatus Promineifilaceae bacterium]|nr:class I SAM-dependent methyltransferase [Candidatus Promineifilaceae bacterium]
MVSLKVFLQRRFPRLHGLWRAIHRLPLALRSPEAIFTAYYERNHWDSRGLGSVSGPGSTSEQTEALRAHLPALLRRYDVRTLLDMPCGDFQWMSQVAADVEIIGADIVAPLIAANRRRYNDERWTFIRLDILSDPLPASDLILCRDCLVHFSYRHVRRALAHIRASTASYLLTTTFPEVEHNHNIVTGEWRPLNLERPPFSFPPPLTWIDEGRFHFGEAPQAQGLLTKRLALWSLESLPE